MYPKPKPSAELVRRLLSTLPLGDYFSPVQLAAQLGWPTARVLEAIEAGDLPARRVQGEWMLSRDIVNDFFRRQEPNGPASAEEVMP